jgi:hypothetical protein
MQHVLASGNESGSEFFTNGEERSPIRSEQSQLPRYSVGNRRILKVMRIVVSDGYLVFNIRLMCLSAV